VAEDSADRAVDDADKTPQDAAPVSQDLKQLQELYDLMEKESLESLQLEDKNIQIKLSRARPGGSHSHESHHRSHAPVHHAPASSTAKSHPPSSSSAHTIKTPLSGVFYRAASPTAAPFVKEGSVADAGQTLCIIEAMKVMNEIKADSRCRIVKILAENARPVNASQALFEIEPE
jgi:acetyl-CoA carboxylase biotin carboxyl carrier protein